ncbi:MAG: hypothetical protein M1834_008171 [Cirrosporium novae-zelandiae]|nr:MAG: hypothetical protein M1834_008171 [Cirrosporium novae-zelandiae]
MSLNTNTDILIAGAVAAVSVDLLVYPLDTLKTRWQSPDYVRIYTSSTTGALNRSMMFRGLYQGVSYHPLIIDTKLYSNGKQVGSVILATIPSSGAFFTTYEGVKHIFSSSQTSIPMPVIHAMASGIAESVSCAILTPAEVLKQNAQMIHNGHGRALIDFTATKTALAKFRGKPWRLWRGYGTLVARNLPFTAMQFPMFEKLRDSITESRVRKRQQRGESKTVSVLERGVITGLSGGLAGSIAAVITTPIDVVKTRVMLAASDEQKGKNGGRQGAWQVGKEVLKTEGTRGIFRGGLIRAVWTFVGSGLYLGVYESGRFWLEERRK